jgi:hypothetical protein
MGKMVVDRKYVNERYNRLSFHLPYVFFLTSGLVTCVSTKPHETICISKVASASFSDVEIGSIHYVHCSTYHAHPLFCGVTTIYHPFASTVNNS